MIRPSSSREHRGRLREENLRQAGSRSVPLRGGKWFVFDDLATPRVRIRRQKLYPAELRAHPFPNVIAVYYGSGFARFRAGTLTASQTRRVSISPQSSPSLSRLPI